ncbi:hypothetical protein [Pseudanabaena sp. BC1403]|uniref:hypothetical protein n=1 Tax=Pseudanabaena sp. BC1403 TaxID=2043171 RepID=UPI000CD82436|nr:hypothetical protein [Pseudanabaena sp. BC1403]
MIITTSLTIDEMVQQRENWRGLRRTIAGRRRSLNREHKIGMVEYQQMIIAEDKISDLIEAINDRIFDAIIIDLKQGATKIQFATDKANEAIAQLEKLNKILQYINLIIGLTQNILFVINTGDVAKIAVILDEIGKL